MQIHRLRDTLQKLESRHGFRLVGGDTVTKESESFFIFTVLGRIQGNPLLRSNARPGQRIYASGRLGDSAAGLALFKQGLHSAENEAWSRFFHAHLTPAPPLNLGPCLSKLAGPVAAIDISDGLSSELWHLSRQSGCRMLIEWSKLDYDGDLVHLPGGEAWQDWVLHGGEGYQLLFTGEFMEADLGRIRMEPGCEGVREIGRVEEGQGVVILDESGTIKELVAKGWSH